MQRNFMEKRRRRPSYLIPILFFMLEILLVWLVISLLNWDLNILQWNVYTYAIALAWIIFSIIKLMIVLKRQKAPYE